MQITDMLDISEQAAEFIDSLPCFEDRPYPPRFDDVSGWVAFRQEIEKKALELSINMEQDYCAELEAVSCTQVCNRETIKITPQKRGAGPLVIFLHGGAYTTFSARSTLFATIPLSVRLQVEMIAVDYPKAPEFSFREIVPATAAVVEGLMLSEAENRPVVLIGDSSGGGLVLSIVYWLQNAGKRLPDRLVLISPWVDLRANDQSVADPVLRFEQDLEYAALSYAPWADQQHPMASPAYVEYGSWCPPVMIVAGSRGLLAKSIKMLHKRMQASGINSNLTVFPGMYHSFPTLTPEVPEAQLAHRAIRNFLLQQ